MAFKQRFNNILLIAFECVKAEVLLKSLFQIIFFLHRFRGCIEVRNVGGTQVLCALGRALYRFTLAKVYITAIFVAGIYYLHEDFIFAVFICCCGKGAWSL